MTAEPPAPDGSARRLARLAALAEQRPGDPDALMFLGNALLEAGRVADSMSAYAAALALRPLHAPTLYNLGNAHLALGETDAAAARYEAALRLDPAHVGSHNNRGNALRQLGRLDEAAACYRAALALRPDLFGARTNLAVTLLAQHRPEEAEAELVAVLALAPDYAEARNTMGGALLAQDRPEEALRWFRGALAIDPDLVQARFGEAMALLTMGALGDGFAAYEARWLDPKFSEDLRPHRAPLWRGGGTLSGQMLLVHHEQGLGDTLQFVRYVPLLRARGARVVLEVQAPLLSLLAPLADDAVAAGAPLPAHDARVPLLSLPLAFATTLATVPGAVPYLRAPMPMPAAAAALRGPGLNVALTCRGNPDHPEDALRSIPPALLAPVAALARGPVPITVHVVHKDDPRGEDRWFTDIPGLRMHGLGMDDFVATAALLEGMDLVVSVDTAVAHLAGALGLPVWILLQHAADFRWLREREDSPWYPTARLFRQGADRSWQGVIKRLADGLAEAAHAFT